MYTTEDGLTKIEVTFDGDTVWLSLDQMAKLFQRDKSTISRHIKNIFSEGELRQEATVAKFAAVQTEGNRSVSSWLSCETFTRYTAPYLGKLYFKRVYEKRICTG